MPPSNVLTPRIILTLCFFIHYGAHAAPTYVGQSCGKDFGNVSDEFARSRAFRSGLDLLFSNLSANTTAGFKNSTVLTNGQGAIYGVFLCRGDMDAEPCRDCVSTAGRDVVRSCNPVRMAVIWYDQCMLRYDTERFFSKMDEDPSLLMSNKLNVTGAARFMRLLGSTLEDVKARAANDRVPPERFATGKNNFTATQTLHALAQCTPDLTSADCNQCLTAAIAHLPTYGSQGSRALLASCNVRYELYPFYNETTPPPPTLRRPPPGSKSPAEPAANTKKSKVSSTVIISIAVPVILIVALFFIGCGFLVMRRRAKKKYQGLPGETAGNETATVESLQFDFGTIKAATENFSENNMIGEGGFGPVYKGRLLDGQEVAVKRLSRSSGQGTEEFKNEVVLVAKLQHKNLIKLLGFCLKEGERILVYEFAPNKSLDFFLFDPAKREILDWSKSSKIIRGIARGILYLHEDSRLKIIHRDLKASNILLDGDFDPKISDFGLARLFDADQITATTARIVGTYGYMSPEYAMHGRFSVKSDVFSFGVLVLEIISGKKNSKFYQSDGAQDLLSYAWKLWIEGRPLELVDPAIGDNYSENEVFRCIHISLLCVQDDEAERPTMVTVLHFLNSEYLSLPVPGQPALFSHSKSGRKDLEFKEVESVNHVSMSDFYPR